MSRLHAILNAQELSIKKLEQEIHNLENQKELQEVEEELIKNYKMIQGDYKVIVTIYEASELSPKPDSFVVFNSDKEHCNAFVEVETLEEKRKTNVKKETNNPIFDEHFHFTFKDLKKENLDNAVIKFTVYDRSSLIIKKAITGTVELDWTSIYFRRNHEIYRGWLTITDPDQDIQGITGYLLVNVAVLGPHDQMTIHDSKYIKDPLTTLEETITVQKLKTIDYTLKVEVYRAEHLLPVNGVVGGADAFVVAKYSGKKIKSSRIKSANPQWNQLLKLGTTIPTRSKYLLLQVWSWNLIKNDLVGVIKIPFSSIVQNKSIGPYWANIYGPSISGKDEEPFNHATTMQIDGEELGSHYRGRLLFKVEGFTDVYTRTYRQKIIFKFPFKPVPNVPQRAYTLRATVIQGIELPRTKGCIQIAMGPYLVSSKSQSVQKDGCCRWMQNIPQRKVVFPYDSSQAATLPDIIIYFNSGELQNTRISFLRVKASKILQNSHNSQIPTYQLVSDRSLNSLEAYQSAGFVSIKLQLFTAAPPPPINIKQLIAQKMKYELRIYLYLAQSLPPANNTGDCDSMLQFRCAGQTIDSEVKWNTRNPTWYKVISLLVEFQDLRKSVCQKGVLCLVYDKDGKRTNFIGKFWMPIQFSNRVHYKTKKGGFQIIYQKPKWFYINNPNINFSYCKLGKVLVGYSLMQAADAVYIPFPKSLTPRAEVARIQIYIIGLRSVSLDCEWKNAQANIYFTDATNCIATIQSKIKNGGCVFNSLFKTSIRIPHNKNLAPFMEISINSSKEGDKMTFAGYNSVNLYELIPNFFKLFITNTNNLQRIQEEKSDLDSSQESILNVGKLEKQLDIIKLKRKKMQQLYNRDVRDSFRNATFDELLIPEQLGKAASDVSTTDQQFNNLLTIFENQFTSGKEYDYVRQLQKSKDRMQSANKNKDLRFKIEQEFNGDEEGQLLNNSMNFSQLNHRADEPLVFQNLKDLEQINFETPSKKLSDLEETRLLITKKIQVNSQATIKKSVAQSENRFKQASRITHQTQQSHIPVGLEKVVIDGFSLGTSDAISSANKMQQRIIAYDNIKVAYAQEKQHQRMARQKQKNSKFAAAVKLSLFQWTHKKKKIEDQQTYEDFDTDPGEDLDITPEWYKGRKILPIDFEDLHGATKKLKQVDIFEGGQFSKGETYRIPRKVASLKFIILAYDKEKEAEEKSKYYNRIMSPRIYLCRLYFLKGKSLISEYHDKPSTSIRIKYGSQIIDLKDKTYVQNDSNPEYYVFSDIVVELPGPATIRVEIVEHRKVLKDHILGYTDIDLQKRYFTKKWHLMLRKPIQLRNLYSDYGVGTQGRLETWIQIIQRKQWENTPPQKIHPPPHQEFQLRVIVWETKDCVIKDEAEQCNDVFVRGWVGTCPAQDTDVHWRCRGTGSFNWRWKFPVTYPPTPQDVYGDMFTVQIWDKDVVGYNELIGETRINLNRIHRIIQKAVKRKKPTKALMKIIQKGMDVTQKMYFDVFNDKKLDEFGNKVVQGRVLLSFELVPLEQAKEKYDNGTGRSEPNLHPTLPDPQGRLTFSCRHPWEYLKQVFGLKFLKKCGRWCLGIVVSIILLLLVIFIISQVVANNTQEVKCVLYNQTSKTVVSSPLNDTKPL